MFWNLLLIIAGITVALYGFLSLVRDFIDFFFPVRNLHPALLIRDKKELSVLEEAMQEAETLSKNRVNYVLLLLSDGLLEEGALPKKVERLCENHKAECLVIHFQKKEEENRGGKEKDG